MFRYLRNVLSTMIDFVIDGVLDVCYQGGFSYTDVSSAISWYRKIYTCLKNCLINEARCGGSCL
jgi:hypothetical protein